MADATDISTTRHLLQNAAIAFVYYAAGELGQLMAIPPGNVSPVWPPSGIALALVLLLGRRIWPGLFLGAFAVNLTFLDWTGTTVLFVSLTVGIAIGVGSVLQPLAGNYLVRRYLGDSHTIHTVGDILKFAAIAPVMCLISASIGSASLVLGGFATWDNWAELWTTWWLGDSVGVLIVTPLILAWSRGSAHPFRLGETALIFLLLIATTLLAFNNLQAYPLAFVPVPSLLWAALRLGMRGTTTAILLVSAISIAYTFYGTGPFHLESGNLSILLLQLFIVIIALTILVIAASVEERAVANAKLEQRVTERTRDLTASEGIKSGILASALDCIISMDHEGHIVEFNPAAEQTFGLRREDVLGHSLSATIIPPAFRQQHEAGLQHYLATGEGPALGQRLELVALHADGSEFPIELAIATLEGTERPLFTAYMRDISEQQRAELQERAVQNVREEVWKMTSTASILQVLKTLNDSLSLLAIPYNKCGINILDRSVDPPELKVYGVGHDGDWDLLESNEASANILKFAQSPDPTYRRDLDCEDVYQEQNRITEFFQDRIRAVLDVPFSHGTFAINSLEPDAFSDWHITAFKEIAQVLSEGFRRLEDLDTLEQRNQALEKENAEREHRIRRQTALAQVRDAVWNLKGTDELEDLVESVLQSLRTAEIPFNDFGINIIDIRIEPPPILNWGFKEGQWYKEEEDDIGREILLKIWRAQTISYRRDLFADDRDSEAQRLVIDGKTPVRCILDIPFSHGTLAVNNTEPDAFSDAHIATLQEIAGVLSEGFRRLDDLFALEERNQALEAEAVERERRAHRQSALQAIRDAIWHMEDSQDISGIFTAVGTSLKDLRLPIRNYGINILNDLEDPTEVLINDMSARRLPINSEAPWTENIVVFWRDKQIVYRKDLDAANPYNEGFNPKTGERNPIRCILDIPFSHGTLAVNSEQPNAFSDWHIDILKEMATILSEGFRRLDDLRKLEESRTFLRGVIDNSTAAIYSKAYDGKYLLINRKFGQLLHISAEEAIGRDDYDFWPDKPEIADEIRHNDLRVLESGQPTEEEEIVPIDGEERIFLSLKFPLFDEQGKVYAMCGMSTDITEIKEAEHQAREAQQTAERANRSKSVFLANMSHEIRTPMNAILGFSEILASQLTAPQHRRYLDSIQTSGKSLLTLINDILDLSKVEAGKLELEYHPVDAHALFTDMEAIFAQKATEKNLAFPIELAPDLPVGLVLDEARVRQVLINLLGNAFKFTEQGEVSLRAEARPHGESADRIDLAFTVTDTGIGIPDDQQAKIFGAFEQREGQNINEYGGTGLGLAISKQLVSMMGGHIELESEVGQGSTFRVVLSGIETAQTALTPSAANLDPNAIAFAPAKVLIADDVAVNRELVVGYLTGYGFELSEAENGQEAIEVCQREMPDLVLMDIKMPVLDGHEATKHLKADPDLHHIPVVALTASAMRETEEELSQVCDGFLKKPIGQAELVHELTRFLAYETKGPDATAEIATPTAEFAPDAQILVQLPTLEQQLLSEQATCEQLLATLTINEIEDFAERMQRLGDETGYAPLSAWAKLLAEQTELFDLDGMQKSLEGFPGLAEKIRETLAANST